jgi:pSer/pThr/pTyr-binding forkhead associated (FHA) protein
MGRNGEDAPMLVAHGGPLNGQRWSLNKKFVIGRGEHCDIVIPERQISRQHLSITPSVKGTFIEDLGSKNGTYYNGDPITGSTLLEDGGVIQIAYVQTLLFISSEATLPLDAGELPPLNQPQGKLVLDKRSRRVYIKEQEILPPLSASQYKLLETINRIHMERKGSRIGFGPGFGCTRKKTTRTNIGNRRFPRVYHHG